MLVLVQDNGAANCWDQHIHSISNMLQLSYQNKQPMTPSAFFDQLARQVGPPPPLASHPKPPPLCPVAHARACCPVRPQATRRWNMRCQPPCWTPQTCRRCCTRTAARTTGRGPGRTTSAWPSCRPCRRRACCPPRRAGSRRTCHPPTPWGRSSCSPARPPPLDLHPDPEAYLDLSPAGSQEEGQVEALARSMQDFMLGAFPLPRPRRPLRVIRSSRAPRPAAQPQAQHRVPAKGLKSPRGASRSSLSPRRSHGKRAAPMQAPDQAAPPPQRLGELLSTDKDSSTTTSGDGDLEALALPAGSSACALEPGLLLGPDRDASCSTDAQAAPHVGNAHLLDVADHFGRCPLHVAAAAGRADIVMHLLRAGCDGSRWLPSDYR